MKFSPYYLLPLVLLFLNFQCEKECFSAASTVTVSLASNNIPLTTNDTLWLTADFSANLVTDVKIAEDGGLFTVYLFRPDTTTGLLTNAREAFESFSAQGEIQANRPGLDEAFGIYWRYECPDEQCGFRIGLVPNSPGVYLLQLQALGYVAAQRPEACDPSDDYVGNTLLDIPAGLSALDALGGDFTAYRYALTTVAQERIIYVNNFSDISDFLVIKVD